MCTSDLFFVSKFKQSYFTGEDDIQEFATKRQFIYEHIFFTIMFNLLVKYRHYRFSSYWFHN